MLLSRPGPDAPRSPPDAGSGATSHAACVPGRLCPECYRRRERERADAELRAWLREWDAPPRTLVLGPQGRRAILALASLWVLDES